MGLLARRQDAPSGVMLGDAEGQVLQNALHAVVVLLPRGAQRLASAQSPGHGRKMSRAASLGVHHLPGELSASQPGDAGCG